MSRLTIALLNNMPDAVLRRTEARFAALLEAAAPERAIDMPVFALPGLPREGAAASWIAARYRPFGQLFTMQRDGPPDGRLDGLIVTGMQPCAPPLEAAAFWPSLTRVIDWAAARGVPTLWSCLGGHAAVQRLDGIVRRQRREKLSGLYATEAVAPGHVLTAGLPARWLTPHSRHYGVDGRDLAACGYRILSRARAPGWSGGMVDAFAHAELPFLFLQGHPEYDRRALLGEYVRDARLFLAGRTTQYPQLPVCYLDEATAASLSVLQFRAEQAGPEAAPLLLGELGMLVRTAGLRDHQVPGEPTLLANWVNRMAGRAADPARVMDAVGAGA